MGSKGPDSGNAPQDGQHDDPRRREEILNEPFVKIDLHGMTQDKAIKVIDKAIASAGPATYHLQLIHGYRS